MWKSWIAAFVLASGLLCAQNEAKWSQFQFMIGKWKADTGAFTFLPELNGQVLARRNTAAAAGQKHDDFMIVYQEDGVKAIYFDNEGHVIHYTVSFPAKNAAVFESYGPGPKYRLSYALNGQKLDGRFDIGGKTYLEWSTVRE